MEIRSEAIARDRGPLNNSFASASFAYASLPHGFGVSPGFESGGGGQGIETGPWEDRNEREEKKGKETIYRQWNGARSVTQRGNEDL